MVLMPHPSSSNRAKVTGTHRPAERAGESRRSAEGGTREGSKIAAGANRPIAALLRAQDPDDRRVTVERLFGFAEFALSLYADRLHQKRGAAGEENR